MKVEVRDAVVALEFQKGSSKEWTRAVVVANEVEGVKRVVLKTPSK